MATVWEMARSHDSCTAAQCVPTGSGGPLQRMAAGGDRPQVDQAIMHAPLRGAQTRRATGVGQAGTLLKRSGGPRGGEGVGLRGFLGLQPQALEWCGAHRVCK